MHINPRSSYNMSSTNNIPEELNLQDVYDSNITYQSSNLCDTSNSNYQYFTLENENRDVNEQFTRINKNKLCHRCHKIILNDYDIKILDCACPNDNIKYFYHEICLQLSCEEARLCGVSLKCPDCLTVVQYAYKSE